MAIEEPNFSLVEAIIFVVVVLYCMVLLSDHADSDALRAMRAQRTQNLATRADIQKLKLQAST